MNFTVIGIWNYRQISNISHTQSPKINVSHLILQLPLLNPLLCHWYTSTMLTSKVDTTTENESALIEKCCTNQITFYKLVNNSESLWHFNCYQHEQWVEVCCQQRDMLTHTSHDTKWKQGYSISTPFSDITLPQEAASESVINISYISHQHLWVSTIIPMCYRHRAQYVALWYLYGPVCAQFWSPAAEMIMSSPSATVDQ